MTLGSYPFEGQQLNGKKSFLIKFNSLGEKLWTKFLYHRLNDWGKSITVDNESNVYVIGHTDVEYLEGHVNKGADDVILSKYDSLGKIFGISFMLQIMMPMITAML